MKPPTCTCGAVLPPDARFCHKCGKPQFDYPGVEPEIEAPPAPVEPVPSAPAPEPPGINMRNPIAVRAALAGGSTGALLIMLPLPPVLQLIWQIVILGAAGFGSVWLYQKRTQTFLSARNGARLGWMAGIFAFLIMLVMFTLSIVAIAASEGLQESFRGTMASRGAPEIAQTLDSLLSSPGGVAALVFGMVITTFMMLTILSAIGGALGAKVLEKE